MELSSQSAKRLFKQPGPFAIAVIKQFRANQGILLAGAVAYYTLLSLVPLLILILLALSHVVDEERLLVTLRASLEFVVPGQADALVGELRNFFTHREVVGSVLLVTMFFFSALAFTVLENAMSVIFFHRVKIKRRHFLVSAVMPYVFIVFLGLGLLVTTAVSGIFQFIGTQNITFFGHPRSLGPLAGLLIYLTGVTGEILLLSSIYLVMPVGLAGNESGLRHFPVHRHSEHNILWPSALARMAKECYVLSADELENAGDRSRYQQAPPASPDKWKRAAESRPLPP